MLTSYKIKPYDRISDLLVDIVHKAKRVVYVEEGIKNGGAAEISFTELVSRGLDLSKVDYRIAAIDDNFASPKEVCYIYDFVGLSAEKLADKMIY